MIIFNGVVLASEVAAAADRLGKEGISTAVIDMHTVKPLDRELVVEYARRTGAVLTCENHQIMNGLGSAVAFGLLRREAENRAAGRADALSSEIGLGDSSRHVLLRTRYCYSPVAKPGRPSLSPAYELTAAGS